MKVNTTRKRQRQSKQQPAHKGNGKGGGKAREEKTPGRSTNSSDREHIQALSRVVLQQADQLHRLECDTGFFLVLATAPAAGTVIPTMFNCSRALAEAASRESRAAHLLTGHHDVSLSATGAEQSPLPCSEIEGGPGRSQAGDAHGQARLEVHDMGQGQREAGARRHSQPHDYQGSAEISAGCCRLVTELAGDDYQVLQHSEAPPGDHQCDDPLPDRCHAEGQSHVPDSASVVPTECLASVERAPAPGSGQAHTYRDQDSESAQSYVLGLRAAMLSSLRYQDTTPRTHCAKKPGKSPDSVAQPQPSSSCASLFGRISVALLKQINCRKVSPQQRS